MEGGGTLKEPLEQADKKAPSAMDAATRKLLHERVTSDFGYHKPDAAAGEVMDAIRGNFINLAHTLIALCPPGRDLSMALSDLETAQRCAIAAVAKTTPLA